MLITVYSQPNCQPCRATTRLLDRLGLVYTLVDVTANTAAGDALVVQGFKETPVVEVDLGGAVEMWSGFKPERLKALAEVGSI